MKPLRSFSENHMRVMYTMRPNVPGNRRAQTYPRTWRRVRARDLPPILLTSGLSCQPFKRRWRHVLER
jgi:hypothetical protein